MKYIPKLSQSHYGCTYLCYSSAPRSFPTCQASYLTPCLASPQFLEDIIQVLKQQL